MGTEIALLAASVDESNLRHLTVQESGIEEVQLQRASGTIDRREPLNEPFVSIW